MARTRRTRVVTTRIREMGPYIRRVTQEERRQHAADAVESRRIRQYLTSCGFTPLPVTPDGRLVTQ